MVRPLVVGIDGSPQSFAAADWADARASPGQSPVWLLNAWSLTPLVGPAVVDTSDPREKAKVLLARVREDLLSHHPGVEIHLRVVDESPVTALLDASGKAALVVLGSRRLGPVSGFLLGSVSAHVVARSACPVVAVRGTRVDGEGEREIVLGLKHPRAPDQRSLAFAFAEAAERGLPLRVVHTWHAHLPPSPYRPLTDELSRIGVDAATTLAEALRPWRADHPEVAVHETLQAGNAAQALVAAAAHAALVVLGRGGRHGPGPRVGAVAHALLHHSPAPVAVVPDD